MYPQPSSTRRTCPSPPALATFPLSTSCLLSARSRLPSHPPDLTDPTPCSTRPFLPPPSPNPKKYFKIRAAPIALSPPFLFFPITTPVHLCLRATHRRLSNPQPPFLGHQATLIKLLLIAPELNLSNLQPSFSNAPPPQVPKFRTSYST